MCWRRPQEHNIDILCTQEHRYDHIQLEIKYHGLVIEGHLSVSAWKKPINALTGGVRILLSHCALKLPNSIEKIHLRMMWASFKSNSGTTIISPYSPTNASDEMDIITFHNELSFLVRSIPKHNVPIIGRDVNAQIGKDKTNKFCLHNLSNRNREYLTDFSFENRLTCLNTKFQKREGKLWTYPYSENSETQIDYILINKKWIYSALNCEVFFFLKEYLSITELPHQRNAWVYAVIRLKQSKQATTGPHLPTEMSAMNMR